MEELYIRVGTTIYKVVQQPLVDGTTITRRIQWSFGTIRQDYGNNNIPPITKYNGFCTVPSHINYQKEIAGFYNLYEPITHIPMEGEFKHIRSLVEHIFGEQYEMGMDYLQLLYLKPTQKLPILLEVFVSLYLIDYQLYKFYKIARVTNVQQKSEKLFPPYLTLL